MKKLKEYKKSKKASAQILGPKGAATPQNWGQELGQPRFKTPINGECTSSQFVVSY